MEAAWKVGELARRAGVTVRTLHHYDEIGLLEPEGRTRAGHRLYGPRQVRRLQQIASLRRLGLSLEEVAGLLDEGGLSLEEALDLQLRRLDEEIHRRTRLRHLVSDLRALVRGPGEPSLSQLTRTIAGTLRHDRYYSPEQLRKLAARREEMGGEVMAEAAAEWSRLLADYADAMERGVDPASPEAAALGRRSAELVERFTGGDEGIRASLAEMYASEGGASILAAHGTETAPGLWPYMARVRAAMEREGGGGIHAPTP